MSGYKGPERRRNGGGKADQWIVVKSYQTLLIVLSFIVSAVLAYGSLRDTATESERRIHELETHTLTIETYQAGQSATEQRLKRIEDKLDAQDMRDFARDAKKSRN